MTEKESFDGNKFIAEKIIEKLELYMQLNECEGSGLFLDYMPLYCKDVFSQYDIDKEPETNILLTGIYREVCNLFRFDNEKYKYSILMGLADSIELLRK